MSDPGSLTTERIRTLLRDGRDRHAEVQTQMRVRRMLINRDTAALTASNLTGTTLPAPFKNTTLAIRTMLGEPAKAAQHYASRIAANRPDVEVVRTSVKSAVSTTADRQAGAQGRLDNTLWQECGGRAAQWTIGWAMAVGGVGYYLTLPRDAGFGLPDRIYYEDRTDDEIATLKRTGAISPASNLSDADTGKMIYAEHGDVWAARRKSSMQERCISGPSLFTIDAFPRDMVLREVDTDGIKWAAIIEEIPGTALEPGGELAMSAARSDGVPLDDRGLYGLFRDGKGRIVGGVARGGPIGSPGLSRGGSFTLVRFFSRIEQVILVGTQGTFDGVKEVYRGKHNCTVAGVPTCPVVEVPFMRTDVNTPGQEFSTALSQVFALIPLLNQIMTLRSNAELYNLIPRWVIELADGATVRNEDGEPVVVTAETTPGLNPQQATAYPGTLKQLTIDTAQSDELLKIYLEQLALAMPAPVTSGVSGTSAAAWQVRQLIQQSQETLRQPVDNHCRAVEQIVRMWHGWLRELDTPVYFHSAPGKRSTRKSERGLVEFDPKDFVDNIHVEQELDTPEEATVRLQEGMELLKSGTIDYEKYFTEYASSEDPRQDEIDMYVQQVKNHVIGGVPAAPGSIIQIVADSVRGALTYAMLQSSPNFAIASAEQMAVQQQQQMGGPQMQTGQTTAPTQPGGGNVADANGIAQPGMGMATTLQQQLGQDRTMQNGPTGAPGFGVGM